MQMKLFLWLQIMFKCFPKHVVWLSWEQQRQEVPRDTERAIQVVGAGMRNWEPALLQGSIMDHLSSRRCFLNDDTVYQKTEPGASLLWARLEGAWQLQCCRDSRLLIVQFRSHGSLLTFGVGTITSATEGLTVRSPLRQFYSLRIQPACLWVGSDLYL